MLDTIRKQWNAWLDVKLNRCHKCHYRVEVPSTYGAAIYGYECPKCEAEWEVHLDKCMRVHTEKGRSIECKVKPWIAIL